ncbi:MAG: EAL domain-containing protein [Actinobacteria bacterium]|nr:EAL domain-containing protein [Actinomycetota bacterium]MBV9254077.1 EAL domain-containing protein [Actinomycetota bacterium]
MRNTRLANSSVGRFITQVLDYLPKGQLLAEDVWRKRHRALIWLLWIHVVGIAIFGLARGFSPEHMLFESSLVGVFAVAAGSGVGTRRFSSAMAAVGLVMSSAVLVHLSGGTIEMHFHFFVMVGLMSLYQDWLPFLLAIGFVVLHHAVFGVLQPTAVFDHKSAINHPLEWAIIHGSFVLAASAASIVAWKLNEEQALHDSLTHLANRKLFQDRVSHALARMQRRPEHLAILFIDLDGFKNVNDTLGHAAGDHVLEIMAERVRACIRPGDTAARLGGDEFAILLEDIKGEGEAQAVADRLLSALLVPFTIRGKELTIGASIGIALNWRGDTTEDLLRNADVAMYTAKENGRGHHAIFEAGMHVAVVDRLELERDLFRAADNNELVLNYQPLIALNTGRLAGVEALVRWDHPERGLLQPGQFIEAAESTGAIVPIGAWVLREACHQARRWRDRLRGQPFTMSVNVSARQLFQADIVATVQQALTESGLEPKCLILELTESVMTEDTTATISRLGALKALGVQLAIDDFGTGYSSLSSLRHLPFDILKIDKLFIDGITGTPAESSFARAILKLARTLDLETVAEGVEDPAQVESLRELHCELGQGFHFARPLGVDGIDALLQVAALSNQWSPLGTAERLQP